jgi:hypothetical protein
MEKNKYWVNVRDQEIVPQGETVNYEFEIEATDQEVTELRERFDLLVEADTELLNRAKTPYEPLPEPDQENKNAPYDERLLSVYRFIHQLGVPKTRIHIEEMNIMNTINPN